MMFNIRQVLRDVTGQCRSVYSLHRTTPKRSDHQRRPYAGLFVLGCVMSMLVSCGGEGAKRSGASGSDAPTSADASVSKVSVLASAFELKTGSPDAVTLTVQAKDAGNAAITGVKFEFSADGGVLSKSTVVSNENGVATVTFTGGDDLANKSVTIDTKVAGKSFAKTPINLAGTSLKVDGPSGLVASQQASLVVTLKDGMGRGLSNQTITGTATGGSLASTTAVTNSAGQASFAFTPNGSTTATATFSSAFGVSGSFSKTLTTSGLVISSPVSDTRVPTTTGCQAITAQTSSAITSLQFSINRGSLYTTSNCATGSVLSPATVIATTPSGSGRTATVYAASPSPGVASVTALASGSSSTSLQIRFVAVTPANLVTQISPNVMAPNGTSGILASVKDAAANPVEGVIVYFQVPTGNASVSPSFAVTNESGEANATLTAGASSTGVGGVTVQASIDNLASAPSQSATATISNQALSISLGTSNVIQDNDADNSYRLLYTATLSDSSGRPLAKQKVTFSRRFMSYGKGGYSVDSNLTPPWFKNPSSINCTAEDNTLDGIIQTGEDLNNNNKLDPDGDFRLVPSGGTLNSDGSVTIETDANGTATIETMYLQSYASWVTVRLSATATVNGANTSITRDFQLPVLAGDVSDATVAPPFVTSPFGTNLSCNVAN